VSGVSGVSGIAFLNIWNTLTYLMVASSILPSFCSADPPGSVNFSTAFFQDGDRFSRLYPSYLPTAFAKEVLKCRTIVYTQERRSDGQGRGMKWAVMLLDST
jgi:hypothetical protein